MSCSTFLTVSEQNRYNRQMRLSEIGREGQEKIKGASVVVIGAGTIGSVAGTIRRIMPFGKRNDPGDHSQ